MTVKLQKFIPSSQLRVSKKTVSSSSLTSLSKNSSNVDKLVGIGKFINLKFKRGVNSFIMKRKERQEERRRKREENIEKKKGFKRTLPSLRAPQGISKIFDNIGNFLMFLAGGFLLNKLLDFLPQLMKIGKIIKPIIVGIYNFGKFMTESVIGFIDAGYAIHDDLRKKVEELGGEEAVEKFDKFAGLFKKVINGAIILAMISSLWPRGPRGRGGRGGGNKICPPCPCLDLVPQPVRVPTTVPITGPIVYNAPVFDPGVFMGGIGDWLKNLIPQRKTNEEIKYGGENLPATQPVINWDGLSKKQLLEFATVNIAELLKDPMVITTLIAAGLMTQFDGPAPGPADVGASLLASGTLVAKLKILAAAGLLIIPASFMQTVNASELQSNNTPTIKMEVGASRIATWRDLEDEPLYTKSIIVFENTKLQPIVVED